jgi:hypothetical protein
LDALCFEYKLLENFRPEKNIKLLANSPIDEDVKINIIYDNVLQSLRPFRCDRSTPSLIKRLQETIDILEKLDDVDYIAFSTISNIAISAFQIDLMKRLSSIYEKIDVTEWVRPIDNDLYVIESADSQFAGYYCSIYDAVVNNEKRHQTMASITRLQSTKARTRAANAARRLTFALLVALFIHRSTAITMNG